MFITRRTMAGGGGGTVGTNWVVQVGAGGAAQAYEPYATGGQNAGGTSQFQVVVMVGLV